MFPTLPEAEPRLQRRYDKLVVAHLSHSQRVAAGLHAPASASTPFAATQAAWRFYSNPHIDLEQLAEPLIDCARQGVAQLCDQRLLVALDWCNLHLNAHQANTDRIELAHAKDLGYELLTALAIGDRGGEPLAPLCLEVRAADGVHSTRAGQALRPLSALDGLGPVMAHVEGLKLGRPPVFIIDREADSVGHYRQWSASHHAFVVRADDNRRVLYQLKERNLGDVAKLLKRGNRFVKTAQVLFKGKPASQFVAETTVVLHRPARQHRVDGRSGKAQHQNIAGPPLPLRLVVSEIRDRKGKVLARWLLLSNLPEAVDAATVALWYYWRWRIESYHKLLKGAGQQMECWQQETAEALTRRLAVAAMAGVVVWQLSQDPRAEAGQMREVLVRLSGRQMKRGKMARPFTEPALLAGLGVLIPMLELLVEHDVQELRAMVQAILPRLLSSRPAAASASGDG